MSPAFVFQGHPSSTWPRLATLRQALGDLNGIEYVRPTFLEATSALSQQKLPEKKCNKSV